MMNKPEREEKRCRSRFSSNRCNKYQLTYQIFLNVQKNRQKFLAKSKNCSKDLWFINESDETIVYPKSQYKKFIKDVVSGTLERIELIEETIANHLEKDINFKKTDKLLKIILFSAVFELMYKHNIPKNVVVSEYVQASEYFLEKAQISYLNAILDRLSKLIRKE